MTFTEAAIEVLRREGKPLHFKKITEIAIREGLLDHVGKIPEEIMADQVAAHCRLPRGERAMLPVLPGIFALTDWGLDEDPAGLDGLVEPPPADDEPYRPRERHPIPTREAARSGGRGDRERRRRDEGEERRERRFPPPAEIAYEILAGASGPLTLGAIAAQGAERAIMPDAFVRDPVALGAALLEDNRRREASGRAAIFKIEGDAVALVSRPEPGERPTTASAATAPRGGTPADLRRAGLAALRRRLRECDGPTVEHLVHALLARLGHREVRVSKRGREHAILVSRLRLGVADVRHCVRVVRSGAEVGRRDVSDTRRDLGHYGAQIGVVVSAGDAGREARGEASAAGQPPVILLCGEALAEAFADAGVGTVPVIVPGVDEPFFGAAAEAAGREEAQRLARREARDREDDRREPRGGSARGPGAGAGEDEVGAPRAEAGGAAPLEPSPGEPTGSDDADRAGPARAAERDEEDRGENGEGDDEDDQDEAEEPGAPGAVAGPPRPGNAPGGTGEGRRRRRRRRRGGRGRGERREGSGPGGPEAPGAPAAEAGGGGGDGRPAPGGEGASGGPPAGGPSGT